MAKEISEEFKQQVYACWREINEECNRMTYAGFEEKYRGHIVQKQFDNDEEYVQLDDMGCMNLMVYVDNVEGGRCLLSPYYVKVVHPDGDSVVELNIPEQERCRK